MGDKYNIEDSIEIANLKKYAEDAVKNKDKDAALEAIMLEYSKDVKQIDEAKKENLKKEIRKDNTHTDNSNNVLNIENKKEKIQPDIASEIEMISKAVSKNILEIEKDLNEKIPKRQDFIADNQKRNAELLRLAFGTSEFEKVKEPEAVNIDKTKDFLAFKDESLPENNKDELQKDTPDKVGFFSKALMKAKKYAQETDDEDSEDSEEADESEIKEQTEQIDIKEEKLSKKINYQQIQAQQYISSEEEMCDADEYDEIYDGLLKQFKSAKFKTTISALFAIVLILLSAVKHFNITMPTFLSVKGLSIVPIFTVCVLAVVILFNFSVIMSGAKDLFSKRQSPLSFMFLSVLIVFLHSMWSLAQNVLKGEEFISFASAVAFTLFMYNIGRRLWAKAHFKNFEEIYAASSSVFEVKNVGHDEELQKIASRFVTEDYKNFYYNVSVGSTGGFLKHSIEGEKDIELKKNTVAIIIAITAVLTILFSFLKGFQNFGIILVCVFAMLTPVNFELVGSLVFSRASKKARKAGAVVAGAAAAKEKQEIEAILLRDRDIFRDGSVVIKGFKVISSEHINHIIAYVASVFVTIDSPAKIAFMDLIDNKKNLLKDVYFFESFESEGIIAFIDGDKILLGNSDFMIKNGIIPPADSLKNFKTGRSRSNMYVAQNGQLVCIFSMGYLLDKEVEQSLNDMEHEYIKAVISTFDPNLSAPLLCKRFSISDQSLNIMRSGDVMKFNKNGASEDKVGRSGLYLTKRDAVSFIALIKAVKNISFLTKTNHLIMLAALIAAPVLWAIVVIMGGVFQITPFAVILFHFLWCIPAFINSMFA